MSSAERKIHPLVAAASVAVVLFAGVGIGVMTGVIPSSFSKPEAASTNPLAATPATPATPATQARNSAPAASRPAASPAKPATRVASAAPAKAACTNCGVIDAVIPIEQEGEGTGLGAVAGGVVGGVLGNQIGKGSGRKIATVAGAAGGAYAGHQIEKHVKKTVRYDVRVRMEDGSYRMVSQPTEPAFQPGDRVKIVDGALVADN